MHTLSSVVLALSAHIAAAQSEVPSEVQVEEAAVVRLGHHHKVRRGLKLDGFGFLVGKAPIEQPPVLDTLLLQGNAELTEGTWAAVASLRLRLDQVPPSPGVQKPFLRDAHLFFQEAYASWQRGDQVRVKLGKVYQRFGREWDYSFGGPLLFNNDLKLRPYVGVSVEGRPPLSPSIDLPYALQLFAVDGESFTPLGHRPGLQSVRHRNTLVANVGPSIKLGDGMLAHLGTSAKVGQSQPFTADGRRQGVDRLVRTVAVDLDTEVRRAGVFVEVGRQFDSTSAISSSDVAMRNDGVIPAYSYVWAAAKYRLGSATTLRLSYNDTFYVDKTRETQLVPGITVSLNKNLDLNGEFGLWRHGNASVGSGLFRDRSLYVVLVATI